MEIYIYRYESAMEHVYIVQTNLKHHRAELEQQSHTCITQVVFVCDWSVLKKQLSHLNSSDARHSFIQTTLSANQSMCIYS